MSPTGRTVAGDSSPEGPRPSVMVSSPAARTLQKLHKDQARSILQRMERVARRGFTGGEASITLDRHEYEYTTVDDYAVVYRPMTPAEMMAQGYEVVTLGGLLVVSIIPIPELAKLLNQPTE